MTVLLQRRRLLTAAGAAGVFAATPALAQLNIEISGVGANQIPIALQPMAGSAQHRMDILRVVSADLSRTGDFRMVDAPAEATLEESRRPDFSAWRDKQANVLATGSLDKLADGRWEVRFYLYDVVQESTVDEGVAAASEQNLRMLAHRIADRIYEKLTGMGGLFCSRLAYVVQHSAQSYELIVADSDGANPAPALRSREPIISPAWSPDGRHLAYVSFEAKKPVVYVHTVATGRRRVVANFRGNNSAPAFSPDGQHLAVALSRDGYTQIFMIKTDGSGVNRFSRSLAIDTEPVFSPDGQWLYFVSDRGGSPQIYRQAISGGQAERVTFGADYAVSPTLSPDGAQLCYVTRVDGRYRVAVMELATGQEKILTGNDFDESPSFAPNGRMIVFASERGRKGVLGTVSIDGSVSAWLSTATGDIREPTWGPLLA